MKNNLWILISFLTLLLGCKDDRTVETLFRDVEISIEKNDFTQAKKDIGILISKAYGNSDAYRLKGIIETKLGEDNSAMNSFRKSLEIDSINFKTYVDRAKLKINLGDYNSAISDCNNARSISISYSDIYKTKGLAFELLEDASNAIIQFEHAIKYGDNSGETYFKLGVLYLNQGDNEKGCQNLSKAGELGYMDAFDLIKSNCNKSQMQSNNDSNNSFGQFRSYPNRYVITFPNDWMVDEISNSDKTVFTVTATKYGFMMSILEFDPTITDFNFNSKSVYEIDKEDFLYEFRQKYSDFKLHDFEKKIINGTDSYYFKMSFSFFSTKLQKTLSDNIQMMYTFLNPKTRKLYYIQGVAETGNVETFEPIFRETIETFKLL